MGTAGAHRHLLPRTALAGARAHVYGFIQGAVQADGSISFAFHELTEDDMKQARWPDAQLDAIHDCFVNNADE